MFCCCQVSFVAPDYRTPLSQETHSGRSCQAIKSSEITAPTLATTTATATITAAAAASAVDGLAPVFDDDDSSNVQQ